MAETLYILREWLFGEGQELRTFTLEELLNVQKTLGMDSEEFSEFITGLSCDSYADESCASLEAMWVDCYSRRTDLTDTEKSNIHEYLMKSEYEYLTCYTVWRLWNTHLTEEQALSIWKGDCIATLEGIIES